MYIYIYLFYVYMYICWDLIDNIRQIRVPWEIEYVNVGRNIVENKTIQN